MQIELQQHSHHISEAEEKIRGALYARRGNLELTGISLEIIQLYITMK